MRWLIISLFVCAPCRAAPVWLLGNDFHTSLVFRGRDLTFAREISGDPAADELAIGWGARADYMGPSTPWTVLQAMLPLKGALHVVPIRGPVTRRFPSSDVVRLEVPPQGLARLEAAVDGSFERCHGRRVFLRRGYYRDSRFYASRERFFFPYVCNEWVALKLRRAGYRFFLPRALLSQSLILQAAERGWWLQKHGRRFEAY